MSTAALDYTPKTKTRCMVRVHCPSEGVGCIIHSYSCGLDGHATRTPMQWLQPLPSCPKLPTAPASVKPYLPHHGLFCSSCATQHRHQQAVVAAAGSGQPETGPPSPAQPQPPTWWPTLQLNRLTSKLWWGVALPSTASLLQQASAEPSVAAYLTAEFCSITDSWKAQKLTRLPPARQHGLLALADGWRATQELYHCAAAGNMPSSASSSTSTSSNSNSSNASASTDFLLLVLPDPCSLILFPCLVGAGGAAALTAWLSDSNITRGPAPNGNRGSSTTGASSQVQLDEQHCFVMQQVLELVMSPGTERRVPPYPPTPRPLWLVPVAQRVVATSQAWHQLSLSAGQAQPAGNGGGSQKQAAQLQLLSNQGLAHMQACVYMPLKDALACNLGPALLPASWLYQVVTATMVLYCSNTARATPDKLIICQAVMADLAAGIEVMRAAGLPLSTHMALYIASQQLAIATDLADLGMQQDEQTAHLAEQIALLAADIRADQPGLMLLFDAYCRLGEYHLHVTKHFSEAARAFELALEAFHARQARTWDCFREWSDDLSSCALWSYWRDIGGATADVQQLSTSLNSLPGAVRLHREYMRCILHLSLAQQWATAAPQHTNAQQDSWAVAAAHDMLPVLTRLLSTAAQSLSPELACTSIQEAFAATQGNGGLDNQASADRFGLQDVAIRYLSSAHEIRQLVTSSIQQQSSSGRLSLSKMDSSASTNAASGVAVSKRRINAGSGSTVGRGRATQDEISAGTSMKKTTGSALDEEGIDALTAPYAGLGIKALSAEVPRLFEHQLEQACQEFSQRIHHLAAEVLHIYTSCSSSSYKSDYDGSNTSHDNGLNGHGGACQNVPKQDAGMHVRAIVEPSKQLMNAWLQLPPSTSASPGSTLHTALLVAQEVLPISRTIPPQVVYPVQEATAGVQTKCAARVVVAAHDCTTHHPDLTPVMLPWIWGSHGDSSTAIHATSEATGAATSEIGITYAGRRLWQACMQLRQTTAVPANTLQQLQAPISDAPALRYQPDIDVTATVPLAADSPHQSGTPSSVLLQQHQACCDEVVIDMLHVLGDAGDDRRHTLWWQLVDAHFVQLAKGGHISPGVVQRWLVATQSKGILSTLSAALWVECWLDLGDIQAALRVYTNLLNMCYWHVKQLSTAEHTGKATPTHGKGRDDSGRLEPAARHGDSYVASDILYACAALVRQHGQAVGVTSALPAVQARSSTLQDTDLVGCVAQAFLLSSTLPDTATAAALQQQLLLLCAPAMQQKLHQAMQQAATAGCHFHGDALAALLHHYLAKDQLQLAVQMLQAVLPASRTTGSPSALAYDLTQGGNTSNKSSVGFTAALMVALRDLISEVTTQHRTGLALQLLSLLPGMCIPERTVLLDSMCQQALHHNMEDWLVASLPFMLGACQYDGGLATHCSPQQMAASLHSTVSDATGGHASASAEGISVLKQRATNSIAFKLAALLTAGGSIVHTSNQQQLLQLLNAVLQRSGQVQRWGYTTQNAPNTRMAVSQQDMDDFVQCILISVLDALLLDLGVEVVQLAASFDQLSSSTLSKLLQHALARELSTSIVGSSTDSHSAPMLLEGIVSDMRLCTHPRILNEALDMLITVSHTMYNSGPFTQRPALYVLKGVGSSFDYTPSGTACACLLEASQHSQTHTAGVQEQQLQQQQGSQQSVATQQVSSTGGATTQQQGMLKSGGTGRGSSLLLAPVLEDFIQSAQLPALVQLLQASVQLAAQTQPSNSSNNNSSAMTGHLSSGYAHHLAACVHVFEQLNIKWTQLGPARAARYFASPGSAVSLGTVLHASTCAQLLLLLTQESSSTGYGLYGRIASATPGFHNNPVVSREQRNSGMQLGRGASRSSSLSPRQKQLKQHPSEPGARGLLLTSVYERSLAWFGEQLIAASPPLVPIAVCQVYLQQGNLGQAVSVCLQSPPALAYLLASPEVRNARALPTHVLVALVQQAASLQNVQLLEQSLQLAKEQGQVRELLACLDSTARARLLLQLLSQPPATDMVVQLIRVCASTDNVPTTDLQLRGIEARRPAGERFPRGSGNAQAHHGGTRDVELGFVGGVWLEIAQAALQVAERASTPRHSTICAVEAALACAAHVDVQHAAPIRLLAAAAALTGSPPHSTQLACEALGLVDDALFVQQTQPQVVPASPPLGGSKQAALHEGSLQGIASDQSAVVNAGLVLLNRTAGVRPEQLGCAATGMARVAVQVVHYLQGAPTQEQARLLSEAAHRAVISLLCAVQHTSAAVQAYEMWVGARQGVRLARNLQEAVMVRAAQQLRWSTAADLSSQLLGHDWRWNAVTSSPAARARWTGMSRLLQCAHLAALAAYHKHVKDAVALLPCIHDADDIMALEQWVATASSMSFAPKAASEAPLGATAGTTAGEVSHAADGCDAKLLQQARLPGFLVNAVLQGLLQPGACSREEAYWIVAWLYSHILGLRPLHTAKPSLPADDLPQYQQLHTRETVAWGMESNISSTLELMHDVLCMLGFR